jgi:S1-C subfamily serine protease
MIRGTAAARAGVEQGDQLLAVDGAALDGATPFQAANLLMGAAEDGAAAVPSVTVTARARRPARPAACLRALHLWPCV